MDSLQTTSPGATNGNPQANVPSLSPPSLPLQGSSTQLDLSRLPSSQLKVASDCTQNCSLGVSTQPSTLRHHGVSGGVILVISLALVAAVVVLMARRILRHLPLRT
ncbi:hypothetical protein HY218_00560 [Candidatus Saccharibacteria bacterium]|nr:hypothetical protein [Candidatus Saccharibacteria bacterium]